MAPPDRRLTLNGADDVQHWRQTLSGQTSILALLHSGSRTPAHTTYTGCVVVPAASVSPPGAVSRGRICGHLPWGEQPHWRQTAPCPVHSFQGQKVKVQGHQAAKRRDRKSVISSEQEGLHTCRGRGHIVASALGYRQRCMFWFRSSIWHRKVGGLNLSCSIVGRYKVDRSKISVSGLSSGAMMTVQMHVAYSSVFMGAGVIAGS